MHSKALEANPNVRNLTPEEATRQLMEAKPAIKELFQLPAGQFLVEYLLAQADLMKDIYFESETATEKEKAYLRGQLQVFDDIIGLVSFMNAFKVKQI
jgi:hypothetical protein